MTTNHTARWTKSFGIVALALAAGGCDGKNTTSNSECAEGAERCACYPNDTCNTGLVCLSDVCVNAMANAGSGNQVSFGGTNSNVTFGNGQGGATANGEGGVDASTGIDTVAAGGATQVPTTSTIALGGAAATAAGGATQAASGGAVTTIGGATLVPGSTMGALGGATSTSTVSFATGGVTTTISTLPSTGGSIGTGGQPATGGATGAPGPNLIKDGTFQSFDTYWNAILQEGDSGTYTRPPTAAAVCITNTSTSSSLYYELSFTVGYPNLAADTFVIEPGATYTLSYTVNATYPISFAVKIGHSVSPWTEVYSYASDVLSTSYKTFSHQFVSATGDSSAGLAFNAVLDLYGKMCFQQVSLTKN